MVHEPTIGDVLLALQDHRTILEGLLRNVDQRLNGVDGRLDTVDRRLGGVEHRLDSVEERLGGIDRHLDVANGRFDEMERQFEGVFEVISALSSHVDERIDGVVSQMATKADLQRFVTKEYLDEKLADLRSDLIVMARKSNKKFEALIADMVFEKRMHPATAQRILAMEPFPQT
jgi:hypothetical protein